MTAPIPREQDRLHEVESLVLALVLSIYPARLTVTGLSLLINGEENEAGADVERAVVRLVGNGQLICEAGAVQPMYPPRIDVFGEPVISSRTAASTDRSLDLPKGSVSGSLPQAPRGQG